MREYVISDLREEEVARLEKYLTDRGMGAGIEHLYWLPCPLLSPVQEEHTACGPHVVALDVDGTTLRMELLVRARNALRCECIAMADARQTAALMQSLHDILQELGIAF